MTREFFHSFTKLLLALAITLAGVGSALAADGTLDPTFGNDGKVVTDFSNSPDSGNAVALQPDGKIVIVGASWNSNDSDFALARYNHDGSLDLTFNTDGKVTTDFGNSVEAGYDVVIQQDSKIVVAGYSYNNGNDADVALARYNSDGSLDTTFDNDGKLTTAIGGGYDAGIALALQLDDKIVVAGDSFNGNDHDFALVRYKSDGSLDTTFDNDGKVTTDFGNSPDLGTAVVLQADGKIIVAGSNYNLSINNIDFALARYNSDGSLDSTFDSDGKVITEFGGIDNGYAVALQPDGKTVVAGISDFNFALARYNTSGSLDTTFDTDGKVITDFGTGSAPFNKHGVYAVIPQQDGKIVAVGISNSDFALARYYADGSLDINFDSDGRVTTDFGGNDFGFAIAIQPDMKMVVAGSSDGDFALARYEVATSAMELTIDVKPSRFPNRIELEKNVCKDDDNLYVAILSTPDFNALTVDASSLKLGDPNLSETATPRRSRAIDVDSNGDMDMALTFPLCNLVTHEALNTSSTELVLAGTTLDGVSIMGRDSVRVVRDN